MFNVELKNKPIYISEISFNKWLDKFNIILENIIGKDAVLSKFIYDLKYRSLSINIEFSLDEVKERYGKYTLDLIKEIILEKFPKGSLIHNEVNDAKSIEDIQRALNKESNKIEGRCTDNQPLEEARGKLRQLGKYTSHESTILGVYINSSKTIKFYVTSIENVKYKLKTTEEINNLYEIVFIHELLHAYHYYLISQKRSSFDYPDINYRTDYTSKVVKESLAKYFEKEFCEMYFSSSVYYDYLFCDLDSLYPTNSPYAGSVYIDSGRHFSKILDESINDLDKALRVLFKDDVFVFFDIKNIAFKDKTLLKASSTTKGPSSTTSIKTVDVEEMFRLYLGGRDYYITNVKKAFKDILNSFNITFDTFSYIDHNARIYIVDYLIDYYDNKRIIKTITGTEENIKTALNKFKEFLMLNVYTWDGAKIIEILKKAF